MNYLIFLRNDSVDIDVSMSIYISVVIGPRSISNLRIILRLRYSYLERCDLYVILKNEYDLLKVSFVYLT